MKLLVGSAVVALLAVITAGLLASVYLWKSEHPLVRAFASSFPAANVDGRKISYGTYLVHVDAQRAFLNGPLAADSGVIRDITDSERQESLERAIRIEAVEGMAEESGVVVTPLDVDRTYEELVSRAGTSTSAEEISSFLSAQFGWDESEYKTYLLRPAFIEEVLRSKGGDTFDAALQARIDGATRFLKF
ncbi:hypothetical protein K8R04_01440 [Candidatus Uhrbacteria bacterium]|nr:hypothetical protein [Candidatus Uhrbacteria bacterium]